MGQLGPQWHTLKGVWHSWWRTVECCDLSQLFRLGDLSPKQRRVQRCDEEPKPNASQAENQKNCPQQATDGDKSPAESGDKSPHSKARCRHPYAFFGSC